MHDARETALLAADAADAKKAFDIQVLDLRGLTSITDYFVICSCGSTTQVSAVADGIEQALVHAGIRPSHVEGKTEASWVLMDYRDVVVHIFEPQARAYYNLERLWHDAPRLPVPTAADAASR